jgi:hypothetical protein
MSQIQAWFVSVAATVRRFLAVLAPKLLSADCC